jgi:hypothetical protein
VNQLGLFDVPAPAPQPVDLPLVLRGRPEVVYRNPENENQAWTGRGKPPRWITEWVESGESLESLRVPGTKS